MSVPLRLRTDSDSGAPTLHGGSHAERGATQDSIAGWLDVLTRMLPARQGAEVREELEEHVRERVRDLVLAGQNDAAATRTAIAELGDAAAVAQRFRDAARTPKRRLAMNLAVLGVAGAALMTSLLGVMRPGAGGGENLQPDPAGGPRPAEVLANTAWGMVALSDRTGRRIVFHPAAPGRVAEGQEPVVAALDLNNVSLATVLGALAESAGATLTVRWSPGMGGVGLEPDAEITTRAPVGSLSAAFDALNDALTGNPQERVIDFRLWDDVLEVARPEWFDQRESTLVRYDLGPLEEQGIPLDEFMSLVEQFVSTDDWENNGGTLAKARVVGHFAFVKGPPRIHYGVHWFLAQFTEDDPPDGDPAAAADNEPVRVYHIQHTVAHDVLKALMNMESIREVDFTPWAADAQNNSILGRAPANHHDMVARAIKDLDNPEAVLKRRVGEKNAEMRHMTALMLVQCEQERAWLAGEHVAMPQRGIADDHPDAQALRQRLKDAQDREAETRARLRMLEPDADASNRRGAAEPAPEPAAEIVAADGRDPALTSFIAGVDVIRHAMVQMDLQHPLVAARGRIVREPALRLVLEPEPITRALLMAHTEAGAVAGILVTMVDRTGEPQLGIEVDEAHNTVILRGPKDQVLAAEEVAWKLDHLAGVLPRQRE